MVKIMLASHGNLAAGMLSSAEMVFGKQDNVSVICAYVDGEDTQETCSDMFSHQSPAP